MVNDADMSKFDEFRFAVTKKYFDDCGGINNIEERPLLYCSFLQVRVRLPIRGDGCAPWQRTGQQHSAVHLRLLTHSQGLSSSTDT